MLSVVNADRHILSVVMPNVVTLIGVARFWVIYSYYTPYVLEI
jgi:hypothetical protein